MIARALLAEAPVLVLDEATTHLDPNAESEILAGVGRWHGSRTLVVISHEAHPAVQADLIVHLEAGRCAVEAG